MLNQNPKVSVITASYNSGTTIEKTIKSVLAQTYPNIEYIIIDGGSTDGTIEIIKKYQDKIAFWSSEPDRGIADAWNKGIAKATGEYVAFIGADDTYEVDGIEKVVMKFNSEPEAGFVFGNVYLNAPDNNLRIAWYGDRNYSINMKSKMTIPHLSVFVKRELFEQFGLFDLNYRIAIDYEFLLRLINQNIQGSYVDAFIGNMLIGGVSTNRYFRSYWETMKISIKYGKNPLISYLLFVLRVVKTSLRKLFEHFKLNRIIKWYHSFFNKRFKHLP